MNPDSYATYDSSWLVHAIADNFGIAKDKKISEKISLIKKFVYKYTNHVAWIEFDEKGILVGTHVDIEGCEGEYSNRLCLKDLDDMEQEDAERELIEELFSKLQLCQEFVKEALLTDDDD